MTKIGGMEETKRQVSEKKHKVNVKSKGQQNTKEMNTKQIKKIQRKQIKEQADDQDRGDGRNEKESK